MRNKTIKSLLLPALCFIAANGQAQGTWKTTGGHIPSTRSSMPHRCITTRRTYDGTEKLHSTTLSIHRKEQTIT